MMYSRILSNVPPSSATSGFHFPASVSEPNHKPTHIVRRPHSPDVDLPPMERYAIRATATFIELSGGQPLDRWKVNRQLPPELRMPFSKLLKLGPKEWYVATWTSAMQRCFFYIPTIYFASDTWNKFGSPVLGAYPIVNGLAMSCFTSALVTPIVSWFEGMKADQQINNHRSMSIWNLTKMRFRESGIRGIVPTPIASFGREAAFSSGIVWLTPLFAANLPFDGPSSYAAAGAMAGIFTQISSQPFDTIKTYQEKFRGTGFFQAFREIASRGGVGYMWAGCLPRVIRGIWTLSCLGFCTKELSLVVHKLRHVPEIGEEYDAAAVEEHRSPHPSSLHQSSSSASESIETDSKKL